ncbi:hypothetical protein Tco_1215569 [Tanacetum coccineum]
MDSILEDSVDKNSPDDNLVDTLSEIDFLPFPECDSVFYEDFSEVDALPSTNNEDKDFLDFEASRARGFVTHSLRASHPQLHFGNPISKSY